MIKEADTLDAAGYQVEVLGAWVDGALAERDRELMRTRRWKYTPVIDMTLSTPVAPATRTRLRARTRLGRAVGQSLGYQNHWQLGYAAPELLHAARGRRADLYIAHSEQALWVVDRLRSDGHRVGVDMEDWFSEDLPPEARRERPARLLRSLERALLHDGAHTSCPSHAMGTALAREFDCREPVALYNAFAWSDRDRLDRRVEDRTSARRPSLHWYSQTLGPGRGLEDLFGALPLVTGDLEVHVRGQLASDGEAWLAGLIPAEWKPRVFVHPLTSNEALLSRISEHDIGFAGETTSCRSRDLTVTNKILHYLLGGLAVVASDTAGQREVASQAVDAVFLYHVGETRALAEQMNRLLASPRLLRQSKTAALNAAERSFSWEKVVPALLRSVEASLATPGGQRLHGMRPHA